MGAAERKTELLFLLKESKQPLSAAAIAAKFHVSRQIIIGDIALLRAAGEDISATPRGYIYQKAVPDILPTRTIACRHNKEQMAEELYIIVDYGCAVLDVTVEHPVYGQIAGQLHIFSRFDVDEFLKKVKEHEAAPLSQLTAGVHLHTVQYQSQESLDRVLNALKQKGLLFEEAE